MKNKINMKNVIIFLIITTLISCSNNGIDGIYKVTVDNKNKSIITNITYTIKLKENNLYNVTLEIVKLDKETKKVNDSKILESEAVYSKENRTLTVKNRGFFFVFSEDLKSFNHDGAIIFKNETVKITEKEMQEIMKKNKN